MGAGVDSMVADPSLPRHVPLLRVIDPLMAERMATWVLWGVINAQRRCDAYWAAQRAARWDKGIENFRNVDNAELRVGVMGLGESARAVQGGANLCGWVGAVRLAACLPPDTGAGAARPAAGVMGGATADVLARLGYDVSAWTRRPRERPGVRGFHGAAQLREFAAQADVLVCLLPLTPETRGILSAELFAWLPPGATVINAARGGHLRDARELVAALDSGHLAGAVLDVFDQEPLPSDSPLWSHPSVRVFPHVSSMTNVETAVAQMLESRAAVLGGRSPPRELVVDWEAGY
jgi:glyoxylate/hydroxypyruvate reductase A